MEQERTEISPELLEAVRGIARDQGRPEREVVDEAVRGYLAALDSTSSDNFRALLDRMSGGFDDLSEDEAMELALEEQRTYRRERAGGSG